MSSERWVEPFPLAESDDCGRERGVDAQQACGDKQPRDKQNQRGSDEDLGEHSGSPARRKTKEVTSEAQVLEEAGRKCPGETAEQGTDSLDGGPGVSLEDRCISGGKRRSSPRAAVLLSYPERERDRRVEEPRGPGPFYFFGGANGAAIVTSYCESRGWQRIYDKTREDFKLKWCETRCAATYYNFKQGEQLLYQIPNNKVLTTKIGLLNSLREYDRISSRVNHGRGLRRLRMEEFFPATFRMDVREEREAFFIQQEGEGDERTSVWICKPTGLNQGRGIFLLRGKDDISALRLRLHGLAESQCNRKLPFRLPQARIVQRYIQNPLLLKGRKFDVRSYFLIACTSPYMVFFRHGYVRLTCNLYDPNSNNLSAHLTNQYMQKKNPLYSVLKEETVWSMERFNAYVNEKLRVAKGLPKDWVLGAFAKRMQQVVIQCFFAVKSKLERKLGYFDLIGCDFMIDEDFKVWLLEMNCNPALHTNCEVLKEVVPSTVVEALDITLEIFDKCRCGLKIVPLASQKEFVLLYDGESPPVPAVTRPSKTAGPLRAQRPRSESCQKPTDKTQRGARQKSGQGGKVVNPTSDVSRTVSETLLCPAAPPAPPTSPLPHASSTSDDPSTTAAPDTHPAPAAPAKPHPPSRASETPKAGSRPPKPAKARVELRLSKCTWQRRSGNPDRRRPPDPPWRKSGSAQVSVLRLGTARAAPVSDQDPPLCCSLKPTQFRLAQPSLGPPEGAENEKGGASGGREPGGDTQSTTKEEKDYYKL